MTIHDLKSFARRLSSDSDYCSRSVLNLAFLLNLLYALFKLGTGIWLESFWLGALGIYYAVLAVIRFLLLRAGQGAYTADRGLRVYRQVAFGMLLLSMTMGGVLFQMFRDAAAFEYPGILIYAMAVYAFAKIISAIMNLIRRRRDEDRILAAARCVSFACALMSILALQTALISQFGKPEEMFAKVMTGVSGCAVLVILIALSATMLYKSRKRVAH